MEEVTFTPIAMVDTEWGRFLYYCPTCDTPLGVLEFDRDGEYAACYPDDPDGIDVYLDCPCCGWSASATSQASFCEAWENVVGCLRHAQVLIVEPEVVD